MRRLRKHCPARPRYLHPSRQTHMPVGSTNLGALRISSSHCSKVPGDHSHRCHSVSVDDYLWLPTRLFTFAEVKRLEEEELYKLQPVHKYGHFCQ